MRVLRGGLYWCLGWMALTAQAQVVLEELDPHDGAALEQLLAVASPEDKGRIQVILGQFYIDQSLDRANEYFDRAEVSLDPTDIVGWALLASGQCITRMLIGDMDGAQAICQRSVALARRSESPFALVRAYSASTNVLYQGGQLERAVEMANLGLEAAKALSNPIFLVIHYNNLGLMSQAQGKYKASMNYFRDGLEILSTRTEHPLYFPLTFNLGVSYANLDQHDMARELYEPALDWSREEGLYRKELVVMAYLALSEIELGQAARAEQQMLSVLERPELTEDRGYLAFIYSVLGHAQFMQSKLDLAMASYQQGMRFAESSPNTFEQRRLDIGYAQVLAEYGRLDEALMRLQDTLQQLEAEGSAHFQRSALEIMLKIAREAGDVEASLIVFEKLLEVQEQVELFELEQELALSRAAYEVDSKERELAAAERDNIVRTGAIMLLLALGAIGYLYVTRRMETQQRQIQGELARRLEEEVDARTRELRHRIAETEAAEKARREMEKQLSEAEKLRVLGQLTGGVAHDFNNLLTVVIGSAELLKVGVDEVKREDLLQHIITAASSGADITRALMSYARKQPLQLESIELKSFLAERIPLISRTMGGTVVLCLEMEGVEDVRVLIDPAQLTAALLNLALNARDAQGNQGEIAIELEQNQPAFVEVSVVDRGVGMSEEQVAHAIEPFYTTKDDNQGNGLGLSMVYGFSKQSGGDLRIQSVLHQGTRVTLVLPVSQVGAIEVADLNNVADRPLAADVLETG